YFKISVAFVGEGISQLDTVYINLTHSFVEGYIDTARISNSPKRYGRVGAPVFLSIPPRVLCVSTTYISVREDQYPLMDLRNIGRWASLRCSLTCTRTTPTPSSRRKS